MGKLLKWAVVAAALAAVASFVPVGGHTLRARWEASRGAADFAARGWSEIALALRHLAGGEPGPGREAPARSAPRPVPPSRSQPGRNPPAEHHRDSDRKALDVIVAERAR